MNNASGSGRGVWPRWVLNVVGYVSLAVAFALGTLGWFIASFGIASNCTNDVRCGSGSSSCSFCAASNAWVLAGGIGQWVLLVATVVILVLGLRRPDWRRTATIAAAATILLSVAWYAKYIAIADHAS